MKHLPVQENERVGSFKIKSKVELDDTQLGPKGRKEFEVIPAPTVKNPNQKRLEIDVPFASWAIVKEDFSNPAKPVIEVLELEG